MIKSIEDMKMSYVPRHDKEVFELFMDKCEEFGLSWSAYSGGGPRDIESGEVVVFNGSTNRLLTHASEAYVTAKDYKRLTLSDLKPHTRTEYEKATYSSAWKAAKDHEERKVELWRKSDLNEAIKGNNWKAIQSPSEAAQYHFDLYRKVEKEIDWRDEVHESLGGTEFHWSTPIAEVINDESDYFLELCRVALRANGEIE